MAEIPASSRAPTIRNALRSVAFLHSGSEQVQPFLYHRVGRGQRRQVATRVGVEPAAESGLSEPGPLTTSKATIAPGPRLRRN
jgi:hypothetical protein